jgi:hypothetical protein
MIKVYPDFKRAENRIMSIWQNFSKDQKQRLRSGQLEWIKNLQDIEANRLIADGRSKIEAYIIVTGKRSDYLL